MAGATCFDQETACAHATGWYIGGELGTSETDFDNDRARSIASAAGLDITSVDVDDNDQSGGLIFGYQFNQFMAVEAGYRDLGEYSLSLMGNTTDPAMFNQIAGSIAPENGSGATLGVVLSYPLTELWKISGKVGIWDWENDNDSSAIGGTETSGSDIYYGLETSYQVTERLQAYLAATRYEFDRDESDNLSLGLRYFFGGESKKTSKPKAAPGKAVQEQPKAPPAPKQPVTEKMPEAKSAPVKDSDGDGVYDDKDNCANTPALHAVDIKGCTVYEKVDYQHQLIIYYPNNSSVIDASYQVKIKELVDFAKDNQIKYMQVVGHTSAPGTTEYNQWLSEQRAESLQKVLMTDYGYTANQIETLGKGELNPAVSGDTESAYSKNRRIDVNLSATGRIPKKR